MNSVMLALRQVRYENSAFWRNPAAAFFTIVFPLMFLVIFNLIFGNREVTDENGNTYSLSTFYVPGIMVFALVGATYTNVAMGIAFARDGGLLKRVRGTPLPSWSYLMGKIIHSVLLTGLLVVIVAGSGWLVFGVDLPTNTLAASPADTGCRCGDVLHPGPGGHLAHPQRRRRPSDCERVHTATAVCLGRVHSVGRRPNVAHLVCQRVPGPARGAGAPDILQPV